MNVKCLAIIFTLMLTQVSLAAEEAPDPLDPNHKPSPAPKIDASKVERLRQQLADHQKKEAELQKQLEEAEHQRIREQELARIQQDTAARLEEAARELAEITEQGHDDLFHKAYVKHLQALMVYDRRIQAFKNVGQIPLIRQELYRRNRSVQQWEQVTAYGIRWEAEIAALKKGSTGNEANVKRVEALHEQVKKLLARKEHQFQEAAVIMREQEQLESSLKKMRASLQSKP